MDAPLLYARPRLDAPPRASTVSSQSEDIATALSRSRSRSHTTKERSTPGQSREPSYKKDSPNGQQRLVLDDGTVL